MEKLVGVGSCIEQEERCFAVTTAVTHLRSAARAAVRSGLSSKSTAPWLERLARFLGRRWPDGYLGKALSYHLVEMLGQRVDTDRKVARLPGGARLVVTLRDYALRDLYFRGSPTTRRGWLYEPETTRFVFRWLRPGDTFVDVGANAGYYTAIAGSLVGPSGHVYAFEPNPPLARLLRETVALNHHQSRTKVEAIAVSSTGGSVRLFRPTDPGATGAATTVPLPSQRVEPGLAVPSVALDKFVSGLGIRSIRLVKVDVEGAELDVLAGATQTLRTVKPDALLCEFCPQLLPDPQSTWREMLRVLGLFGYYPFFLDLSGRLELGSSRMPTWKVGNVCFKQIE